MFAISDFMYPAFYSIRTGDIKSRLLLLLLLLLLFIIKLLLISALGVLDSSCESSIKLLKDLDFPEKLQRRLIPKIMNIAIRCTYYILCHRNKDWTDPELMDF